MSWRLNVSCPTREKLPECCRRAHMQPFTWINGLCTFNTTKKNKNKIQISRMQIRKLVIELPGARMAQRVRIWFFLRFYFYFEKLFLNGRLDLTWSDCVRQLENTRCFTSPYRWVCIAADICISLRPVAVGAEVSCRCRYYVKNALILNPFDFVLTSNDKTIVQEEQSSTRSVISRNGSRCRAWNERKGGKDTSNR